jgi:type II secretory pathway pseudopilin PulG
MKKLNYKKGVSIVEIIISASIISMVTLFIVVSLQVYISVSNKNTKNIQSALLIEETAEVLQFLRDISWNDNIANLNLNTEYYLEWNNGAYAVTSTPNLFHNVYTRKFILREVMRDSNDSIIESGGTEDPKTLKAEIIVEWQEKGQTESNQAETLIHNVYDN